MHPVTAILRRTLLQHIPVVIEGIGTLRTVRSGAQFLTGQRLEPPRRMPELTFDDPAGHASPLTELVATGLSVDPVTADGICRSWRETLYADANAAGFAEGTLLIDGIGTVAFPDGVYDGGAAFFPDPALLELLNPLPAEPLVIPSPARRTTPAAGTPAPNSGRPGQRRTPKIKPPKGKNPHNYTVSFLAVLVALAALGYLCYYLWARTDILADFLPR